MSLEIPASCFFEFHPSLDGKFNSNIFIMNITINLLGEPLFFVANPFFLSFFSASAVCGQQCHVVNVDPDLNPSLSANFH